MIEMVKKLCMACFVSSQIIQLRGIIILKPEIIRKSIETTIHFFFYLNTIHITA